MVATSVTLASVAVGQENAASVANLSIAAVQELQSMTNAIYAQPVMELTSTSTQSIPTSGWTAVTFSATPTYSAGSGLTASTTGVTISASGRYVLECVGIFTANATGVRLMSINTAAAGTGSTTIQTSAVGSATNTSLAITSELSCTTGDKMSMYVFQNSGGALTLGAGARLIIRQMTS